MDLATKFKMVTKCQQTKIMSLNINTPYPIERAERVVTKYGDAILVTLQAPETFLKVFLLGVMGLSLATRICVP